MQHFFDMSKDNFLRFHLLNLLDIHVNAELNTTSTPCGERLKHYELKVTFFSFCQRKRK